MGEAASGDHLTGLLFCACMLGGPQRRQLFVCITTAISPDACRAQRTGASRSQRPEAQRIGSICSRALILAALGRLEGKSATTHPQSREALSRFPVEIVDEPLVYEGNVATAGGCLAAVDLTRWIVESLAGASAWRSVLTELQPVGRPWIFPRDAADTPRVGVPSPVRPEEGSRIGSLP